MTTAAQVPDAAGYSSGTLQDAANHATSGMSASSLLEQVFGTIATDPLSSLGGATGTGDILGTVFMFINMGLLTLGGIFISYKSLVAITNTAHDGEFMGKSFHNTWVPIRLTVGVFSLLPIAGGWSALQVIMLWFGVLGAGLGNMAWQGAVGANFLPFKTVTLSPSASGTTGSFDKNFIPELFKIHACVYANNARVVGWSAGKPTLLGSTTAAYGSQDIMTSGADGLQTGTGSSQIGYKQYGSNGGANSECGQVQYADVSKGLSNSFKGAGASIGSKIAGPNAGAWGGTEASAVGVDTQTQRRAIEAAVQAQFVALDAKVDALAAKFVFGPSGNDGVAGLINNPDAVKALTPYDPVAVHQMSTIYQSATSDAIAHAMHDSGALTDAAKAMAQHAQEDGFTTAGAWYMTMAQTSYAMNSLANNVSPTISKGVVPPQYADGNTIWFKTYDLISASGQSASGADAAGGNADSADASSAWKHLNSEMHWPWSTNPGQSVVNWIITDESGEPVMIRIKNIADRMVTLASVVVTGVGAVDGIIDHGISGAVANAVGSGWVGAARPWIRMCEFVAEISIGFFLACSIYLPVVPFVVFSGQVLNWLITVVEGVSAAPFLAFAHLDTDGEGLGQKTHYGYTFMLQSFMRPVMLVLGFMFSCILLEAIGGYVMQIYPTVMANAQMDSVTGLFSIIGFTALFFVIMVGLVNTCMTVMYLLPDAIFQFIGAGQSATSSAGRNESENAKIATAGAAAVTRQASPMKSRDGERGEGKGKGRGEEGNGLAGA